MTSSKTERALAFANNAHSATGQVRKYTNEPYICHPIEVASIVSTVTSDEDVIAAAFLHDTIEDTAITHQDILLEFGTVVAELVRWVSDVSTPADGTRAVRKAIDREHISKAPADAKTIKLADVISNIRNIADLDPKFAGVYLQEKKELLLVLEGGDTRLLSKAQSLLDKAFLSLKENNSSTNNKSP